MIEPCQIWAPRSTPSSTAAWRSSLARTCWCRRRRHAGDRRGAQGRARRGRRRRGAGGDGRARERRHRAAAPDRGRARACDVFIAPTTRSLSHTIARKRASDGGARGATMPGVTEDMLARVMAVDFDTMAKRSRAVAAAARREAASRTSRARAAPTSRSSSTAARGSPTTAI